MARFLIASIAFCLFASAGYSADNAEKVVGMWRLSKIGGKELPVNEGSATLEFKKDGKAVFRVELNGKELIKEEITYKVTGDIIETTAKENGKDKVEKITIKSITDDAMVLFDPEKKEEMELKKSK